MNKNIVSRRDFLAGCMTASVACVSGCKHVPSEDTVTGIAFAFGGTTGLVLEQFNLESKIRNTIVDIVNRGYTVVPAEGQTILAAWKEVAERHVAALVRDCKITATQGDLILAAFDLVLKGVSLLIDRYPDIETYGKLAVAAICGFCNGFLAVYKPVDSTGIADSCESCTVDVKAYNILKRCSEARKISVRRSRVR